MALISNTRGINHVEAVERDAGLAGVFDCGGGACTVCLFVEQRQSCGGPNAASAHTNRVGDAKPVRIAESLGVTEPFDFAESIGVTEPFDFAQPFSVAESIRKSDTDLGPDGLRDPGR